MVLWSVFISVGQSTTSMSLDVKCTAAVSEPDGNHFLILKGLCYLVLDKHTQGLIALFDKRNPLFVSDTGQSPLVILCQQLMKILWGFHHWPLKPQQSHQSCAQSSGFPRYLPDTDNPQQLPQQVKNKVRAPHGLGVVAFISTRHLSRLTVLMSCGTLDANHNNC